MQRIQSDRVKLFEYVECAVANAKDHVGAIGQDEADRTEQIGQLVREKQKRYREHCHVVVVTIMDTENVNSRTCQKLITNLRINLFACVCGKHKTFGNAIEREKHNCQ